MTSLALILNDPILQRVGWALLHSLWQGMAVVVLLAFVLVLLRHRSAQSRYLASCFALLLMVGLPALTACFVSVSTSQNSESVVANLPPTNVVTPVTSGDVATAQPPSRAEASGVATPPVPQTTLRERAVALCRPALPWIVVTWLVGVVVFSLRLVVGWVRVQRIKHAATRLLEARWQQTLVTLAGRLGVMRPVWLVQSALVQVPTAIGWLRPVVLLPASALTGLTPEQLEAILAHELAHIRRYDYLVNLIQTALETLLFYHPASWWVSRRIRAERENCCDDLAVSVCGNALVYAGALAEMETLRASSPQLAAAVNGGVLLDRIRRLLGVPAPRARSRGWAAGLIVLSIVAAMGLCLQLSTHAGAAESAQTVSSSNQGVQNNIDFQEVTDRRLDGMSARMNGASMSNGCSASLLAIGRYPADASAWWLYNGSLLAGPPIDFALPAGKAGDHGYVFLLSHNVPNGVSSEWNVEFSDSRVGHDDRAATDPSGKRIPGMRRVVALFPKDVDPQTVSLKLRVDGGTIDFNNIPLRPGLTDSFKLNTTGTPIAVQLPRQEGPVSRSPSSVNPVAVKKDALPSQVWPVRSLVEGIIAEVKCQVGQDVKKGDILVQLDDAELKLAYSAAGIRSQQADKELQRAREQHRSGFIPSEQLAEKEAAYQLAAVELQRCELRLQRTRIVSPADGKVRVAGSELASELGILVGKRITPGETILMIESVDSPAASAKAQAVVTPAATQPAAGKTGPQMLISAAFVEVRSPSGGLDPADVLKRISSGASLESGLRTLMDVGVAEVISQPKVLVNDSQEATITIGEKVPFVSEMKPGPDGKPQPRIDYKNVGIAMNLKARWLSEGSSEHVQVSARITQTRVGSSSVQVSGRENVKLPIFEERTSEQTLEFRDGETLWISCSPNAVVFPADKDHPAQHVIMLIRMMVKRVSGNEVSSTGVPVALPSTMPSGIAWGESVNGLQAGIEFVGSRLDMDYFEPVDVRLHVRNVSDHPIAISTGTPRQDNMEAETAAGEKRPVLHTWFSGWTPVERHELRPGEKVELKCSGFGFVDRDYDAKDKRFELLSHKMVGNTLRVTPGRYRIRQIVPLPDVEQSGVPTADVWRGTLYTGWREVTIQAR